MICRRSLFPTAQKGVIQNMYTAKDIRNVALLGHGGDGKSASVGHFAEKYIEVGYLLAHARPEVAVGHGKLVKIAKQRLIFHLILLR